MAVQRITGTELSYDGGLMYRGYPGRVDLVEWVAGDVSSAALVESVDCHWLGGMKCPDVSTSKEGWLALTYPEGGEVAVDEAVWTFDARDLLPAVPVLGRVIGRSEVSPSGSWTSAYVVGERIAMVRTLGDGLDLTSLVDLEPIESIESELIDARPIPGSESFVYRDGGVFVTALDTGSTTQVDDPNVSSDLNRYEVADDGSVMVFSEIDEVAGVYFIVAVPLSGGIPGAPEELVSMSSPDPLVFQLSIAPDGGAVWWELWGAGTGDAFRRYEFVGLGGNLPTQAMILETDRWPHWSASTGSLVYRVPNEDALEFLDRATLQPTRVVLNVPLTENWQPCGPGVVFESEDAAPSPSPSLHWVGLDGEDLLLSSRSNHWLCSPEDDYVAYVSETGLNVRRLTPTGLGDAELVASVAEEHYFAALEVSPDASTLVYIDCPQDDPDWPDQACPGVLSAWDVETSTSTVLLDDDYILSKTLVPLALPPVAG